MWGVAAKVRADVQAGKRVDVTPTLAMAAFDLIQAPNLHVYAEQMDDKIGDDCDVLYLPQPPTGRREPPPTAGFRVQSNRYLDGVRLGGLRVANTPAAYNYARYVRVAQERP